MVAVSPPVRWEAPVRLRVAASTAFFTSCMIVAPPTSGKQQAQDTGDRLPGRAGRGIRARPAHEHAVRFSVLFVNMVGCIFGGGGKDTSPVLATRLDSLSNRDIQCPSQ
jgi:hypothetical protein